jgi:Cytochrome c peroxidase
MKIVKNRTIAVIFVPIVLVGQVFIISTLRAQVPPPDVNPLASLKTVPVPEPENLAEFVRDKAAAIQLGKALFWDMQVGSDGIQACASCHFHAGADNRFKNQLSPGLLASPAPDTTFQIGGPNYKLTAADFPFTKHTDPNLPNSPITSDSNDVASSLGVFRRDFVEVVAPDRLVKRCDRMADDVFNVRGINTRRVEPRNTPSVINAVFNFRNLWDGRAQFEFNGANPFGNRDSNARIFKVVNDQLTEVKVEIKFSSLASQASGPPRSFFEMSCDNRRFAHVGRQLTDPRAIPLGKQRVHPKDSVLGPLARSRIDSSAKGLTLSYAQLIMKAFRPEYWSSLTPIMANSLQFTQLEANFSLFFSLAVQLYEVTLISDETPLDKFLGDNNTPPDPNALTDRQKMGLDVFQNKGLCSQCHGGPELTNASVRNVINQRLKRMILGDNGIAVYDNGFYNIGVRPSREDEALGRLDPFGNPLSETKFCQERIGTANPCQPEVTFIQAIPEEGIPAGELQPNERTAVNGNFKTPSLRSVLLTGPYFHNGGKASLRQVVDFYNRGGDFANENRNDLDPDIQPLELTEEEKTALVDFLAFGLLDKRVRFKKAPFDHPELFVPNGHPGDETTTIDNGAGEAKDILLRIPAVGAGGVLTPLKPFLNLNPFQP